jgi:hypothetical protein
MRKNTVHLAGSLLCFNAKSLRPSTRTSRKIDLATGSTDFRASESA